MRNLYGVLTGVWMLTVTVGLGLLWRYEGTPSRVTSPAMELPVRTDIHSAPSHYTLVMAVHPKCPCTHASLRELAQVMAHRAVAVRTYILLYRPKHTPGGWAQTALYAQAAAIPGVTIINDEGGLRSKQFQVTTSGHTLLYDPSGHLLFSGGITSARGHEGDNMGQAALTALLGAHKTTHSRTPVFGCSLLEESSY